MGQSEQGWGGPVGKELEGISGGERGEVVYGMGKERWVGEPIYELNNNPDLLKSIELIYNSME